jgi:predicted nucleic acid-binding protein
MKNKKPKHYVDSCVLIGYLNEEPDKFRACRDVVKAAEEGLIEVFTSELTGIELIKLGDGNEYDEEELESIIEDFIHNSAWLRTVAFEREMAKIARYLRRKYKLKSFDAIHLSTAIRHRVDYFNTTDLTDFQKSHMPRTIGYSTEYDPVNIQYPCVEGYTSSPGGLLDILEEREMLERQLRDN